MPRKIGIWGGSFDPVHVGHLILAQEAVAACRLDRLIWVPSGDPPHKVGPVASCDDRVCMVERAVDGQASFSVSRIEVDRCGKSYTVQTLEDIRRAECTEGDQLYLLIGADNAVDFVNWQDPDRVMDLAEIVVLNRPGSTRESIPDFLSQRMLFLDTPLFDVSSTAIRKRLREGMSIQYWVPDSVRGLIETRRLYV